MEIYIDNEKIKLTKKNKTDFEKIMKIITKKLEKNEKLIKNIYINGNILKDSTIIDMSVPNILEVETKGYVDLIIESIESSVLYIETFFEIILFINDKIENGEKIEKYDIEEVHGFLIWFKDLLYLIEETYNLSIYNDFNEMLYSLEKNIKILIEKRKKKRYTEYLNILEVEIIALLQKFRENKDFYHNKIIEEEKKKQLVS